MQPITVLEWLAIANERAADAEAILNAREISVGSVYMAGYGIECSVKGYLRAFGRPFPQAGSAGHNLTALWKSSGFKKRDIGGHAGTTTFFFELWNTGMRYSLNLDLGGATHRELVRGAKQITGWLQTQIRRQQRRRGRF